MKKENYDFAKSDHSDVAALVSKMGAFCAHQKVRAPAPKKKKGKKK